MKNLLIVCDKQTEKYANYLRQLISTNDDNDSIIGVKDGEVETSVWTEEQYKANSVKIRSTQHILFIGNNNSTKAEKINIKFKLDKHGMKCGWLGKRAVAYIDKNLNDKEYNEFFNYCKEKGQEFDKQELKLFKKEQPKKTTDTIKEAGAVAGAGVVASAGAMASAGALGGATGMAGAIAIAPLVVPIIPLAGVVGILANMGIKTYKTKTKISEQQYIALINIFYLDFLVKFLEN